MIPVYQRVDINQLRPNPWNPNAMDPVMYARAKKSIKKFGFVDPVTVREVGITSYQIIDGENRWKAAVDLKHTEIDIANLGFVEDEIAQQLTIVLNELRGEYDPKKMGTLLTGLVAMAPLPELLEVLPFTQERFEELAELPHVDWEKVEPRKQTQQGKWSERVYRLPADAAIRLDEAIEEDRNVGEADWEVLLRLVEGKED